jgi:hypothetical protein
VRARLLGVLTCGVFAATGIVAAAPSAAAAGELEVTVHLSPSPHVDDKLVVSGVVQDAGTHEPVQGAAITIMRTDPNGTQPAFMPVMPTGTDGAYSATDEQPAVRGTVSYAVHSTTGTASGDGSASTYVNRLATSLHIAASRSIVVTGRQVRLTAHLGPTWTNRAVTIYALPYDRVRKAITTGDVDPTSGDRSATYRMSRRTRFTARFAGDDKYAPAAVYVIVRARAVLNERLRGSYATSGAYHLYRAGRSPELDARLWPNQYHVCLYFRAQYYSNRAWHYASLSPCVRTAADGRAAALLNNALQLPYRLRAEWRGNTVALANHGPWLHLRFR